MKEEQRCRWFTAAETAAYFSLQVKMLYSLAAQDRLQRGAVLRLGRQLRFDIATIEENGRT